MPFKIKQFPLLTHFLRQQIHILFVTSLRSIVELDQSQSLQGSYRVGQSWKRSATALTKEELPMVSAMQTQERFISCDLEGQCEINFGPQFCLRQNPSAIKWFRLMGKISFLGPAFQVLLL